MNQRICYFQNLKIVKCLLNKLTQTPQRKLGFKFTKTRQTFAFKPSKNLGLDCKWMIGLTCLEVYNYIFYKTAEITKFELHTDLVEEYLFTKLKDELEEILVFSNIPPKHLQVQIKGPPIFKAFKKPYSQKRRIDGYYIIIMSYARSPFRHFERYLKIAVALVEDDVQLILKQIDSDFVTKKHPQAFF